MSTLETSADRGVPGEWESIRYVAYVTAGWLLATAIAVVLLMTVVPALV